MRLRESAHLASAPPPAGTPTPLSRMGAWPRKCCGRASASGAATPRDMSRTRSVKLTQAAPQRRARAAPLRAGRQRRQSGAREAARARDEREAGERRRIGAAKQRSGPDIWTLPHTPPPFFGARDRRSAPTRAPTPTTARACCRGFGSPPFQGGSRSTDPRGPRLDLASGSLRGRHKMASAKRGAANVHDQTC